MATFLSLLLTCDTHVKDTCFSRNFNRKSPDKESTHLFNGSTSNGAQLNREVLTCFILINWKYYPVTYVIWNKQSQMLKARQRRLIIFLQIWGVSEGDKARIQRHKSTRGGRDKITDKNLLGFSCIHAHTKNVSIVVMGLDDNSN